MSPRELQDFAGRWQIDRVIDDALTGQSITGQGVAHFIAEPTGHLVYEEALSLIYPDQPRPFEATRRYIWQGQGGVIEIRFEDGRLLQRLSLSGSNVGDVHHCDPDRYDGRYEFADWPQWRAIWRVTGPRKDYLMTTVYRRG